MTSRPSDLAMAEIIRWLQARKITAHLDRNQRITLREKQTGRIVYQESRP